MSNRSPKILFAWRQRVTSKDGPAPLTRHVLLTLATYMDERGTSWPTIEQLVDATGLSKPTVVKYVAEAQAGGWIRVQKRRTGQDWAHNHYQATFPPSVTDAPDAPEPHEADEPEAEGGKPGLPPSGDAVNEVNHVGGKVVNGVYHLGPDAVNPVNHVEAKAVNVVMKAVNHVNSNSPLNSSLKTTGGGGGVTNANHDGEPEISPPPPPPPIRKRFEGVKVPLTDDEREVLSRIVKQVRAEMRKVKRPIPLETLFFRYFSRRPLGVEMSELALLDRTYDRGWLEAALAGAASKGKANLLSVRRWIETWEERMAKQATREASASYVKPNRNADPPPPPPRPITFEDLQAKLTADELAKLEHMARERLGNELKSEFVSDVVVRGSIVKLYLETHPP